MLTATITPIYYENFLHKNVILECDFPPWIVFYGRFRAASLVHCSFSASIYGQFGFAFAVGFVASRRLCRNSLKCEI